MFQSGTSVLDPNARDWETRHVAVRVGVCPHLTKARDIENRRRKVRGPLYAESIGNIDTQSGRTILIIVAEEPEPYFRNQRGSPILCVSQDRLITGGGAGSGRIVQNAGEDRTARTQIVVVRERAEQPDALRDRMIDSKHACIVTGVRGPGTYIIISRDVIGGIRSAA